jgi:hypothetical protein
MAEEFNATEPTADMREAAKAIRGIYVALRKEGFTESQALVIVGQVLAANSENG